MAVCSELNERDMGLLLSVQHPSTRLQVNMQEQRHDWLPFTAVRAHVR